MQLLMKMVLFYFLHVSVAGTDLVYPVFAFSKARQQEEESNSNNF